MTGTEKGYGRAAACLQSFCKEYTTRFSDAAGQRKPDLSPYLYHRKKKQNNGNKNIYFISGIDTDAGKSYCTAWYARELMQRGLRVITKNSSRPATPVIPRTSTHRRLTGTGYLPEDKEG